MKRLVGWAALASAVGFGCGDVLTDLRGEDAACAVPSDLGAAFAFDDVRVVSYETAESVAGQVVVVRDGRIVQVAARGTVEPGGMTIVPGCGRFLSPGLADMHVHLRRTDLTAYLESGVTTVRNLWGFPDLLAMRSEIEAGALEGPTVYVISSGLDGQPAKWPFTQFVLDADDAVRVIEDQVDRGYRTLKLYDDLAIPAFDAIVAEATARGLDYGGHVPHRVGLEHALGSGYRFIEHLSGYDVELGGSRGTLAWRSVDSSRYAQLAARTVAAGTWNSPTLEIFAQLAGRDPSVVRNRRDFVKELFDAGAPLLIGTDSGIGRTQPGVSVHQEIAHFVAAGLTPAQALRIATVEAAAFLGEEGDFGRVATGQRADLILTRDDPLVEPATLGDAVAVVVRGRRAR